MNQYQTKGNSKATAAVLFGVGAAAGAAALQSANASISPEVDQLPGSSPSALPLAALPGDIVADSDVSVVGTSQAPAPEPAPSIEQLVDAYLNEDGDDAVSVEALSEADLQDHLPESELQALVSQPGVQVAQSEGGGGLGALFGGGGGMGTAAVIGGVVLGAYAVNEVLDDDDSNGTV